MHHFRHRTPRAWLADKLSDLAHAVVVRVLPTLAMSIVLPLAVAATR